MKLIAVTGIITLVLWACAPVRQPVKTSAVFSHDAQDSTEYEILIIDPGFDLWNSTHYSPAKDYSNEYYRNKNWVAVSSWNEYFRTGKYSWVIDSYIDYQPSIDYGIEVNRKLFWYFRFIREKYRIRL